jgi:hypothetical protein
MPDLTGTRPDVERVVIDLLTDAGVAGAVGAFNPSEDFPLPAVLVHRAGGGPVDGSRAVLMADLVGLDVYATNKPDAWDLTADVLEVLLGAEAEFVGSPAHAWLSGIEDAGGTVWLPDESTGRARYSAVVRVYARGESAVPGP